MVMGKKVIRGFYFLSFYFLSLDGFGILEFVGGKYLFVVSKFRFR